ncbi:NADH dehydrogenase subunit C [Arcticibacter tournemirensis]|uniref:NADH-quinone oxidoreductase subunit C n=1 Tax=Arcticibacter tournemirensis TaxID=699437 RepID=A0A5M9HB23_9SPHI|nr:NADH-quinone oxidoreductase subunit C [Arcticibacter tournemirensis]KAA8484156.1 NADH-quinone oxidoreductase subunit C [Arcticibacter tournemirensis]TQM51901.1 NADH dehydrogenase subunit C [Arcticibacter tournemirensis]
MGFEDIKALLINKFGEGIIVGEDITGLQPALIISPERIAEVCLELRDNEKTWFDQLSCLSGVDYGIEENMFGVVYHLASIPYKTQLTLKVRKYHDRSRDELPSFPTVSSVWKTADWHEREAYDLLGIGFEGHPDLRRILLPDDWEGYPLRKDYKVQEYYHGIKVD